MDSSYGRDLIVFAAGAVLVVVTLVGGAAFMLWRMLREVLR